MCLADEMARPGMVERLRGWASKLPVGVGKRVDHYLTANLPRLISEHRLATRGDLGPLEEKFSSHEEDLVALESWQGETETRVGNLRTRIEILENKYGLGGA